MLNTNSSREYARLDKNAFKSFLKDYFDWAERIFMGRLFEVRGHM